MKRFVATVLIMLMTVFSVGVTISESAVTPLPTELPTLLPTAVPTEIPTSLPTEIPTEQSFDMANFSNISIMINGVRVGFFDDQNRALNIAEVDNAVYVPLFPLLDSLGVSYSIDGGKISITTSSNGSSASATYGNQIEITSGNFTDYFTITHSVINQTQRKSGFEYTGYGDIQLVIDAKAPFEIHDVNFVIEVHTNTDKNVRFTGIMPQNASYSSISKTQSKTFITETGAFVGTYGFDVLSASGYIVINK